MSASIARVLWWQQQTNLRHLRSKKITTTLTNSLNILGVYNRRICITKTKPLAELAAASSFNWLKLDDLNSNKWALRYPRSRQFSQNQSNEKKTEASKLESEEEKKRQQVEDEAELEKQLKENGNLSLYQRFKQMYKQYWYVLIPVHCVISPFWYGGFYYLAKSGFDVVPYLEYLGVGETILEPLRSSGAGYFAVAYALYKIATPARYAVTLAGTTISIRYLKRLGYIKPMPSSERMKEIIKEKGDELRQKRDTALDRLRHKKND